MAWDEMLGTCFDDRYATSGAKVDRRVINKDQYVVIVDLNGKQVRVIDNMKNQRTVRANCEFEDGSKKTYKTFCIAEAAAANFLKG